MQSEIYEAVPLIQTRKQEVMALNKMGFLYVWVSLLTFHV